MALNLYTVILTAVLLHAGTAAGAVVEHDFNLTWVNRNPDGLLERPVIGVNGQWPLPQINATVGDRIVINVLNSLGDQTASIHFHGLFMNGTSHMDGTSFVSQCAIAPDGLFTYNFTAQQAGTYWYHSHTKSQYPDGLRGLLIVQDPESPYLTEYDEEISVTLSDWYHQQMPELLKAYDHPSGHMANDPSPQSNLINDAHDTGFRLDPSKRYLMRVANIGAFLGQYFWITDHTLKVIEIDGVYSEPAEAESLYVATGQRYAFVLLPKRGDAGNSAMIARLDTSNLSNASGRPLDEDAVAMVVYGDPPLSIETPVKDLPTTLDDMTLIPLDREPELPVDRSIKLDIDMSRMDDGYSHWMFNTIGYREPQIPSLFAALGAGINASDPAIYPTHSHTFVLEHNEVIEIVMKNKHMRRHPIHLHGHNFQVTHRSGDTLDDTPAGVPPMRRDTVLVNKHGTMRMRFRADNPGVWIFHCHMEWHSHTGMVVTIIEAPQQLQQQVEMANMQLNGNLDPEKVCQAQSQGEQEHHSEPQDSSPFDSSSTPSTSRTSVSYLAGYIVSFSVIAALIAFVAYKIVRAKGDDTAYALVPLNEDTEVDNNVPKPDHR